MERKAYPSDICDEEGSFVATYLTLMTEEAPQRNHKLAWGVQRAALTGAGRSLLTEAPT
jgi:hypothetical protein